MIVDHDDAPREVETDGPVARALVDALDMSDVRFRIDRDRAGIDLLCVGALESGPNRARVKIFAPRPGTTVAFVYKDSQIPLSTDRFAYGALILKSGPPSDEDVVAFIEYLVSGLHPELRPASLKRAFPFDIPR